MIENLKSPVACSVCLCVCFYLSLFVCLFYLFVFVCLFVCFCLFVCLCLFVFVCLFVCSVFQLANNKQAVLVTMKGKGSS